MDLERKVEILTQVSMVIVMLCFLLGLGVMLYLYIGGLFH